jgi:hypothetical protein
MHATPSRLPPRRLERAALAAGDADGGGVSDGPGGAGGGAGGGRAIEGLDFHKRMLDESRRVEEYERLNRISGARRGVGWACGDARRLRGRGG